ESPPILRAQPGTGGADHAASTAATWNQSAAGHEVSGAGTTAPNVGCYDDTNAATLITAITETKNRAVCSAAQVDGFFTDCIEPAATQVTCDTFIKDPANTSCQGCMIFA